MVILHCILYCTRVPHATSKSVLNGALSSHPLPWYVHSFDVTCNVSGRLHSTNRYGAHTAGPTGTHAREARAPHRVLTCTRTYMFRDMSRTLICVYISASSDAPAAPPPPPPARLHTYMQVYSSIHALAYGYVRNGPSGGRDHGSTDLPTGVTATRTASPPGRREPGAPASLRL